MALLGIDIGGTKIAFAVFDNAGNLISVESVPLSGRGGKEASRLVTDGIDSLLSRHERSVHRIEAIGVSVPGIYHTGIDTVWVPNIKGWVDYPLPDQIKKVSGEIPVVLDSDRACSIMGEMWKGGSAGVRNAVFITVGTGIGAGILVNGEILRGADDIAGAVGWMALESNFEDEFRQCGCFEYNASGKGIAKIAAAKVSVSADYKGSLKKIPGKDMTANDVIRAFEKKDPVAIPIIRSSISAWGKAAANLISIFNPEKIIFGGGVFGPAEKFLPEIREEAAKWAQPLSFKRVTFETPVLGPDAAVYGAAFLALKKNGRKK